VIVAFYFGVMTLIYQLPYFHQNPILDLFVTIVIVLGTIRPVRKWARGTLTKFFNPRYFKSNQRIKQLKHDLQITQPYQEIIDQVLQELESIFDARIIAIILRDNSHYSVVNYIAPKPINLDNVSIDEHAEVIHNLHEKGRIIRIDRQSLRYNPTPQRQADYRFKDYKLFNYAIPLKVNDSLNGAILTSNLPADFIRDWENGVLEDFAEYMGILLQNSAMYNEIRWEALQKNTLFEISKKVTSTLDTNRVLETVIDSLNEVVDYSAAGIYLIKNNQTVVRDMIHRGYEENKLDQISLKVTNGVVGKCIRERRPIIVSDVLVDSNYVKVRSETRSEMCVPIYDHAKHDVIGAFNIESDRPNAFSKTNLDRLTTFAEQVSIAIENAKLYQQAKESKRYRREIEVAKEIQNAFLPKKTPKHSRYDFAAICKPSQDVGGDFYDLQKLSDGKIGIAIGDVAGKGIPGAILMANLYAGYRSRVRTEESIHGMVHELNKLLVESTNSEKYTTFFYGELDPATDTFTYCNAGHNPPLLIHQDGTAEELTTGGPVVGVLDDAEYNEQSIQFKPGDFLLLYTDGITEAQDVGGQYYEVDRLLQVAYNRQNNSSAEDIIEKIHRDVYQFTRSENMQDDVTVIVAQLQDVTEQVRETA
jgi:serine phosphatase RsbU (regulator of sigma subunit)